MSAADDIRQRFESVRVDLMPKQAELRRLIAAGEYKKAEALAVQIGGPLPRNLVVPLSERRR